MPSSKFTVPFRRDVRFLGRKEILNKLQDILHFSEYHHRAALVGLGGIGYCVLQTFILGEATDLIPGSLKLLLNMHGG